ncbi:MAG: lysophospholipid acyltransferase family protein [Sciscionella sp.]
MPEFVYPPVILTAKAMFRVLDLRIRVEGAHHIPRAGAAVLASNHVSYLDFIFCGLAALPAKRLVRFMAKQEIFDHPVGGPLMRGMRHIPVDREAGDAAYQAGLAALRAGQVLGVFPEATISRSFTVKEVKTGAARMASVAAAPLVPMAVWGPHRLWTKGRPRDFRTRHVPVLMMIGEPLHPRLGDDAGVVTGQLRERISELLQRAQAEYPASQTRQDDRWWLPAHLGGTAPTPQRAAELDARGGPSKAG